MEGEGVGALRTLANADGGTIVERLEALIAVVHRLRTIYEKLHVTNRTQAALYALRQGWAVLDELLM